MSAKFRLLNINNVVSTAKESPDSIIEEVQAILDDGQHEIPTEVVSSENIIRCQQLMAYYVNEHSYLLGLWGALRAAAKTDRDLIAVRDYLEEAKSAAKLKHEAASRQITAYQEITKDANMRERKF